MPEYTLHDLKEDKFADLDYKDAAEMRRDVIRTYDVDGNVVMITSFPKRGVVGFILCSHKRGIYVWAKPDGTARDFDPYTGKLTTVHKLSPKGKKEVAKYVAEHMGVGTAKPKKKTVRRGY